MAKNSEVYKTSQERAKAFYEYCKQSKCPNKKSCSHCCGIRNYIECGLEWLDLEAEEEKPLPCPFCGGKCYVVESYTPIGFRYRIECIKCSCSYSSKQYKTEQEVISAHNRVAKAVKESEGK